MLEGTKVKCIWEIHGKSVLISQWYKWPELKREAGQHRVLQLDPERQNLRNTRLVKWSQKARTFLIYSLSKYMPPGLPAHLYSIRRGHNTSAAFEKQLASPWWGTAGRPDWLLTTPRPGCKSFARLPHTGCLPLPAAELTKAGLPWMHVLCP